MSVEFVDTNVLVYAHDTTSPPKQPIAIALIERLWAARAGRLSTQVLLEFFATARKAGLTPAIAANMVDDYSRWPIYTPTAEDVAAAARLSIKQTISIWDALIVRSALQSGCDVLWSEDLQDGRRFGSLRVQNPFRG
jgi:predicted nucleic acid-binding protein